MAHAVEMLYRTEDIRAEELQKYYVETPGDRKTLDMLKARAPVLLRGSRGVGKTFLLRFAEVELKESFAEDRVLPVYVTFSRAGLLRIDEDGFMPWMIARISNAIKRAVTRNGISVPESSTLVALTSGSTTGPSRSLDERVIEHFEGYGDGTFDANQAEALPDPDELREAIEDLCEDLDIQRIVLLIDEAAHVFVPAQQREFFTMMRDLRSPRISVKAAVYPGATSFGQAFQPTHDATVIDVERGVTDPGYREAMRQIVLRQHPEGQAELEQYGEAFDVLAFASMGNPRVLLKTYAASLRFNRAKAQDSIREYYRESVWAEHSNLGDRYPGHRALIDWGRTFLEHEVLPTLHARNIDATSTSSAIWIHRDAPKTVHFALSLLCYSGILLEGESGIRATRKEIGTRYVVNFGCNFAQDAEPVAYGTLVRDNFSLKRMQEFGSNHAQFAGIRDLVLADAEEEGAAALTERLEESYQVLELTQFQKSKIAELGITSIGQVLSASEEQFQTLHYVGEVRARQIRNAAITAVIEYLSG